MHADKLKKRMRAMSRSMNTTRIKKMCIYHATCVGYRKKKGLERKRERERKEKNKQNHSLRGGEDAERARAVSWSSPCTSSVPFRHQAIIMGKK